MLCTDGARLAAATRARRSCFPIMRFSKSCDGLPEQVLLMQAAGAHALHLAEAGAVDVGDPGDAERGVAGLAELFQCRVEHCGVEAAALVLGDDRIVDADGALAGEAVAQELERGVEAVLAVN